MLNEKACRRLEMLGVEIKSQCFGPNSFNLQGAQLSGSDLTGLDLIGSDLSNANLTNANLSGSNLSYTGLECANLSGVKARSTKFIGANFSEAILIKADLTRSAFTAAKLENANLRKANLSCATGLLDPASWLINFERDEHGILVYRSSVGCFPKPSNWEPEPGKIISEVVNPDRCTDCGCGVSFATKDYIMETYATNIWLCRIRWIDLAGVVVPYNTIGKARCSRLEYLKQVI